MDSNVKFSEAPWDESNEVSALHLSFLVQTLLPLHTIKWDEAKRHYIRINADIRERFSEDDDLQCIVTGSLAEGYGIPGLVIDNKSPSEPRKHLEHLADIDILCVATWLKICTSENLLGDKQDQADFKGYFEYISDSPGYVRICFLNPKAENDAFVVDPESGKYYLNGIQWLDQLFNVTSNHKIVTRQGPAFTVTNDYSESNELNDEDDISVDNVVALPGYPWPMIANDWKERIKRSDWPTADVVDNIIKDGCHVVAVPSKQSERPDLEWRLSFSASEGKLAREAVTDHQRQCFIYVKILHHQKTKPMGILSSYMFKSVFLHCCERLPVSHWRDYPGNCILYILDVVIDCLRRKHVPTYFLPENNLIGHFKDDEIQASIALIESIRKDPITPVLEFTDRGVFYRQSVYKSFRKSVSPLIDDMVAFKDHRNREETILNGFMKTGYRICNLFLSEKYKDESAALVKYQGGIRHLINIYNFWLKPINQPPNSTLAQFIDGTGLTIKNTVRAVRFFEAATSLSDEFPEFASLRGNLAALYHGASYLADLSPEKKDAYITKAEELFKSQHDEASDKFLNVDYVVFLVKQNRLQYARRAIEEFLSGTENMDVRFTYESKERHCLVEPLKQYVDCHGQISGDAVAFAYFYLAYCVKNDNMTDSGDDFKIVIRKFEERYSERKDGETLVLLNFAKSLENDVRL